MDGLLETVKKMSPTFYTLALSFPITSRELFHRTTEYVFLEFTVSMPKKAIV